MPSVLDKAPAPPRAADDNIAYNPPLPSPGDKVWWYPTGNRGTAPHVGYVVVVPAPHIAPPEEGEEQGKQINPRSIEVNVMYRGRFDCKRSVMHVDDPWTAREHVKKEGFGAWAFHPDTLKARNAEQRIIDLTAQVERLANQVSQLTELVQSQARPSLPDPKPSKKAASE